MDFFTAFNISASALTAQRTRLNVISSNMANVHSTQTPGGGPYRRKDVVFSETRIGESFSNVLDSKIKGVDVTEIIDDPRPFKTVYDPYHPSADKDGYVRYPNVNVIEEMVNLLSARRSYEANVSVIKAAKNMVKKALEIGK
jgi:flagellar basal-body rod protein FlgC